MKKKKKNRNTCSFETVTVLSWKAWRWWNVRIASYTRVYEPQIRARLGTTANFGSLTCSFETVTLRSWKARRWWNVRIAMPTPCVRLSII